MFMSLLNSLSIRILPIPTIDLNQSYLNLCSRVAKKSSSMASKSYTILKTWAIITSLLCVFSFFSIVLYLSLVYSIMPTTVQESMVSIHKDHNRLIGMTSSNIILEKEKYKILLKLNLPEDDKNYEIGNFETSLSFAYNNNKELNLQNLGMMKYYSPTLRIIRSILRSPFIIMNLAEESEDVLVEYNHYIENPNEVSIVKVYISPRDLRVNSISMVFEVQLTGLRLFMQKNKILSFFIGTTLIFASLLGSFLLIFSINLEIFTFTKPENITVEIKEVEKPKVPFDFSKILKPLPTNK